MNPAVILAKAWPPDFFCLDAVIRVVVNIKNRPFTRQRGMIGYEVIAVNPLKGDTNGWLQADDLDQCRVSVDFEALYFVSCSAHTDRGCFADAQ